MVEQLLQLKSRLDEVLTEAFNSSPAFADQLTAAFQTAVNSRSNKPAELVAKYIDAKLRGSKGVNEGELETALDKALVLFGYIQVRARSLGCDKTSWLCSTRCLCIILCAATMPNVCLQGPWCLLVVPCQISKASTKAGPYGIRLMSDHLSCSSRCCVYMQGKDVFEAFYKKDLAKRLLLGRSASMDAEKLMISKLKAGCGGNFTANIEGMFR